MPASHLLVGIVILFFQRKLSGAIIVLSLFAVRAESDYSILSNV